MLLNMQGGCIIAGGIARDAEVKEVGPSKKRKVVFSIAYDRGEDGKSIYAKCAAWGSLGDIAADIKQGDYVLAAGKVHKYEHNGNTYTECNCDYISISRKCGCNNMQQTNNVGAGFTSVDDGELPF